MQRTDTRIATGTYNALYARHWEHDATNTLYLIVSRGSLAASRAVWNDESRARELLTECDRIVTERLQEGNPV